MRQGLCIEALGLPTLFTHDQRRANHFDLGVALLLSPNEIADVFAVVGVVTTLDRSKSRKMPKVPRSGARKSLILVVREGLEPSTSAL
jgi:hypothetical protein